MPFDAKHTELRRRKVYELPSTDLLNEPAPGNGYDSFELKDVAGRIKSKLEEFNVLGSVVQINPGPVVTTFEYKPEAGIKYSRITTLHEDLCLGLQAESVLIERFPANRRSGSKCRIRAAKSSACAPFWNRRSSTMRRRR